MSENLKKSEFESATGLQAGALPPGNPSETLLARRKMLLTSIGKGSAVVAAVAVPMQSLAAIGTTSLTATGKRCTISGVMSGVHSRETITAVCRGRRGTYYNVVTNWPNYSAGSNPNGMNGITGSASGFTFTKDTLFNNNGLFGSGVGTKLIDIFNGSTTTEYYHWATALLNGTLGSTAVNFPYTAQQVIDLYNNPAKRADALAFFTTYMEG
jgi:hypothetical protein